MVSSNYDFTEYVNYVKDMDVVEIITLTQSECFEAERKIAGGRRGAPKAREDGCQQYIKLLKGLIFFLCNGVKPYGVSNLDFIKFKPIVEKLVEKGKMQGSFWLKFFEY